MRGAIIVLVLIGLLMVAVVLMGSGSSNDLELDNPWVDRIQEWFEPPRVSLDELETANTISKKGVVTLTRGSCRIGVAAGADNRTLEIDPKRTVGVTISYKPDKRDEHCFEIKNRSLKEALTILVGAHGGVVTLTTQNNAAKVHIITGTEG